jgi:hypothetical protein
LLSVLRPSANNLLLGATAANVRVEAGQSVAFGCQRTRLYAGDFAAAVKEARG